MAWLWTTKPCHPLGSWKPPCSGALGGRGKPRALMAEHPRVCRVRAPRPTYLSQIFRGESSTGLGPLPIGPRDLRACSWRERAVRGSWDGFGSFLAGIFFLCVFWGFVCLFGLNGFSLFPAGALPSGCGGVCVWGSCGIKGSLCSSPLL